jgi:hypothetical protein
MSSPVRAALVLAVAFAAAPACAAPPQEPPPLKPVENPAAPGAVAGLPFAQGRTFSSLDEYLAFRRGRGAHDIPYYREVGPGVYELVGRRGPDAEKKTYTRQELMQQFGFTR